MKSIFTTACLLFVFSGFAETPEARCVAARDAATQLLTAGSSTDEHTARWRAAEKRAFSVCTSPEVPARLRNEATVRWAGALNDASAELSLLKKALRETEAAEGADSHALLPVIDRLAGLHSIKPAKRDQALELAERGLRIRRNTFGETSPEVAEGLVLLGLHWAVDEMPDRNLAVAEQYLRDAVTVAENACGPSCPALFSALSNLHAVLKGQPGREAEAAKIGGRLASMHAEARSHALR